MSDVLITTSQAALLHDVTQATIRSWQARGYLTPAANVNGANLYRVQDVDDAEHLARTRDVSGRSKRRL